MKWCVEKPSFSIVNRQMAQGGDDFNPDKLMLQFGGLSIHNMDQSDDYV